MSREETGKHLDHLDGWRGLAVSLVIFGHFWGDTHLWSGTSKLGVDLFFALSGRLMSEILFVRKTHLPTFFLRRMSRVYPALLVYVAVTTAVFAGTTYAQGLAASALALTFTINYGMIYFHAVALMDHLWSLCVEEHSYVLLAVVAVLTQRAHGKAAWICAGLGLAAVLNGVIQTDLLHKGFFAVNWRTDVAAAAIFLPVALWLFLRAKAVPQWLAPAALALAVACKMVPGQFFGFGLGTFFLSVAVVSIDKAPSALLSTLSRRSLRQIGIWSYSLYLWQQPFYKLHHDGAAPMGVLLGLTALCALVSFYWIERPARNFINDSFEGYRRRARAKAVPPAPEEPAGAVKE